MVPIVALGRGWLKEVKERQDQGVGYQHRHTSETLQV